MEFVLPGDYVFTTQNEDGQGVNGTVNSDADPTTGITPSVTLASGETNNNIDAGAYLQKCPDTWAARQDKWDEILNGQTEPGDNPDGDRYSNLIEYAFCLPPHLGVMKPFCLFDSESVVGGVDGLYRRTAIGGAKDVTYILEWTAELESPTTWTGSVELDGNNTSVTNNGDGTETVRISDLETLTGLSSGSGFVRIRVDLLDDQDDVIATDTTEVLGWVETEFGVCCSTYCDPFLECAVFTGTVSGVDGQNLEFATSADGFDLATLLDVGVAYYIEVETGTLEGHRFDITGGGEGFLTLANDSDLFAFAAPHNTLTGAAPAALQGSRIALHRHKTLDQLFPPSDYNADASAGDADRVQFYISGVWHNYWLTNQGGNPRWVTTENMDLVDMGGIIVPPGRGMFFDNRSGNSAPNLAFGEVRAHDFHNPLPSGVSLVAGGYPVDQAPRGPGSRELNLEDGFFGSRDFKTADSIFRWRPDIEPTLSGYDTYFLLYRESPLVDRWMKQNDATLTSRDSELLFDRDRSVLQRHAAAMPDYQIPAPWSPGAVDQP